MKLQSIATVGAALSLIGLLPSVAGKAEAATVSRVADINPGIESSHPYSLTVFDNALYFRAHSGGSNFQLWKYDGTTATLLTEPNIVVGGFFSVFDDSLYFDAYDDVHGSELWKYDGTAVSLVADINPGSATSYPSFLGSSPFYLRVFNNALYFSADDGVNGRELWKYDGTAVSLVADINPGSESSDSGNLGGFTVFDDALYFSAYDGVHGTELWKYDGTTASLVADIFPGRRGSSPGSSGFTIFNNALYFGANPGPDGYELWKYDGTTASLADGSLAFESGGLTVFDDALYFRANGGVNGDELWKYDGTAASLVADISPGPLTVFDDALYFSAYDGVHGNELWKYDGTAASLVADIKPGSRGSNPVGLTVFNNALYFAASDRDTIACYRGGCRPVDADIELWKLELDEPTSVPEPTSVLGLLAFGAFGAGSMLKRKLQKATQLGIVDSATTDRGN